jgi:hypothetical protein
MIAIQMTATVDQDGTMILHLPTTVRPGVHDIVLVMQSKLDELDDGQLKALYAEFAYEDRMLAEAGMDDYAQQLAAEDSA